MEISFYNQWVDNGCSYNEGVNLYNTYGNNYALKILFAKGENYYTRNKLKSELQNLKAVTPLPAVTAAVIPKDFKTFREPKKRIDTDTLPDSLKSEYFKLGPLVGEMRYLHAKLDTTNEEERRVYALRIVEISEIRRGIFNKIDEYQATGKLPVEPVTEKPMPKALEEMNDVERHKELLRLRVQRSKLKNKPHKQTTYNAILERIEKLEQKNV